MNAPAAIACALLLGAAATAPAATLRVEPGQRIGAAIARALPGDVIEIARGRYAENLRIDKPLTLRGRRR